MLQHFLLPVINTFPYSQYGWTLSQADPRPRVVSSGWIYLMDVLKWTDTASDSVPIASQTKGSCKKVNQFNP
jgi:hypothetical protein